MAEKKQTKKQPEMSKEEQIGYHKGSLATLMKERQELVRMVQIVEQLLQFHMNGLKELGIDLSAEMGVEEQKAPKKASKGTKKPIDEII